MDFSQLLFFVPEAEGFYQHRLQNKNPETAVLRKPGVFTDSRRFDTGTASFDAPPHVIENPAGSTRSGVGYDGKPWSVKMTYPYGYFKHINGADNEGLDCFIGPNKNPKDVYIVHQNNPKTGEFDEDKVMWGFDTPEEAKTAYLSNYNTQKFYRSMTIIPSDDFDKKLKEAKSDLKWKQKSKRNIPMFNAPSIFEETAPDIFETITYSNQNVGNEANLGQEDRPDVPHDSFGNQVSKNQPQNTIQPAVQWDGTNLKNADGQVYDMLERQWKSLKAPVAPDGIPKDDIYLDLEEMQQAPPAPPIPSQHSNDPAKSPNNQTEAYVDAQKAMTPNVPTDIQQPTVPDQRIQQVGVKVDPNGGNPNIDEKNPKLDNNGNSFSSEAGVLKFIGNLFKKLINFSDDIAVPNNEVPVEMADKPNLQVNVETEKPQLLENEQVDKPQETLGEPISPMNQQVPTVGPTNTLEAKKEGNFSADDMDLIFPPEPHHYKAVKGIVDAFNNQGHYRHQDGDHEMGMGTYRLPSFLNNHEISSKIRGLGYLADVKKALSKDNNSGEIEYKNANNRTRLTRGNKNGFNHIIIKTYY